MENKNNLFYASLIIGLCLIIVSGIISFNFYKVKSLSNVLSVTGSAEEFVTSDIVKWISSVYRNVTAEELKNGSSLIRSDLEAVKKYLVGKGIADEDVQVNPLVISVICESQGDVNYDKFGNQNCNGRKVSGYSLQQNITVESKKVKEITDLSRDASDYFISQNVFFSTESLEYYYSQLNDLRLRLIAKATENAKSRAQMIANNTGKKVGNLQSAGIGVFQITAKNSVEFADYGTYDTDSIEKKVTAIVKASFSLK